MGLSTYAIFKCNQPVNVDYPPLGLLGHSLEYSPYIDGLTPYCNIPSALEMGDIAALHRAIDIGIFTKIITADVRSSKVGITGYLYITLTS